MKIRDENFRPDLGVKCETCKNTYGLEPSHFVRNNHVHKRKRAKYDYNSTDNYFTQCRGCHMEYESLGVHRKLPDQVTRQDYMRQRGFEVYAKRIEYWVNP
jgi:hypothetical protein